MHRPKLYKPFYMVPAHDDPREWIFLDGIPPAIFVALEERARINGHSVEKEVIDIIATHLAENGGAKA